VQQKRALDGLRQDLEAAAHDGAVRAAAVVHETVLIDYGDVRRSNPLRPHARHHHLENSFLSGRQDLTRIGIDQNSWFPIVVCGLMLIGAGLASATDEASAVAANGKVLVAADGARLGTVYRVGPDGAVQMILDGKMITVPASTLSSVDGRLVTSLSKNQVLGL
jgi:hypothetical protein